MAKTLKTLAAGVVMAVSCVFSVVFLFKTGLFPYEGHRMMAAALLAMVFVFGFAQVTAGTKAESAAGLLWLAAGCAAVLCVRCFLIDRYSGDYVSFLAHWVEYFRNNGGFGGLGGSVGNYNVTYLYFLALFSYSPLHDLYLIKLLSIVFDFILAFFVMKTVEVLKGRKWAVGAFFTVLFLPTVVINGSMWAQCDSIYAAFAVGALYYAMKNRTVPSLVMLALSFSFKIQAVFIMPLWAMFFLSGKMKFRWLWVFPATFIAAVLPAVLLGKPFGDIVRIYTEQTTIYADYLNLNSPSVFALFTPENPKLAKWLGIVVAFVFCGVVIAIGTAGKGGKNRKITAACALLFCIGVPWLLPHMHERYFYLADVISLALAFTDWRFIPVCALVQFASFACYLVYYGKGIVPLSTAAICMGAALLLTIVAAVFIWTPSRKK